MAIYHLAAKVISRGQGRSAIAAAAYRAGERITCLRTGLTFDYRLKKEVAYRHIFAPKNSPEWVKDRSRLWNEVELAEKRRDSQLCREIELALPHELSMKAQIAILEEYVLKQFVKQGMVADVALHAKEGNAHAHILLTLRHITPQGFGQKCRTWNTTDQIEQWRFAWASHANRKLSAVGSKARIDNRSLEDQGIQRLPTVHEGVHRHMAGRGLPSFRQELNRLIKEKNMTTQQTKTSSITSAQIGTHKPSSLPLKIDAIRQRHNIKPKSTEKADKDSGFWFQQSGDEEPTDFFTAKAQHDYWEKLVAFFGHDQVQRSHDQHGFHLRIKVDEKRVVYDYGSKVRCASGSDEEIRVAIQLAKVKGWKKLRVSGDKEFRRRAFFEAIRQGFKPDEIYGYIATSDELANARKIAIDLGLVEKEEVEAVENNIEHTNAESPSPRRQLKHK